ncbi:lipocalin-like domain-containing protein [Actinacidiphila acidipaludis]|uniref:Lipocalin-like domain-containing protein n=1 Tax=Actinacidiphila acidipaludis TaxID=2873382 RepID=A0ABS7QBH2_9ACTN|nr:lipocalin-like domain-containing protein [Streptomyces acidipaludis]MBY8880308.1 lipocalin-like domain-containing protein [Streptomyces acidipaludis]
MTTANDLRERLLGAWRLVSYVAVDESGDRAYPLGEDAEGLIVYTPQGWMSAQLMRRDRSRFAEPRLEAGSPDELVEASRGFVSYAGTFRVLDERTLSHDVSISLYPNWLGGSQIRIAKLDEGRLELSLPEPTELWGSKRNATLTWARP